MFSETKNKSKQREPVGSQQNLIAHGTKIVGNLESKSGFRVDGTIEGNLKTTSKVVVGKNGLILGKLQATDAHFEGKLKGKLLISGTLTLKATAVIEGDVITEKLDVEPGAQFNANCQMKSTLKDIDDKRLSKPQKTA